MLGPKGRFADRPDLPRKADLRKGGVDLPIKPLWHRGRQLASHDPQLLLLLRRFTSFKPMLTLILNGRSVLAGFSTGC